MVGLMLKNHGFRYYSHTLKNVIDISKFDYFVSFVYRDGNW